MSGYLHMYVIRIRHNTKLSISMGGLLASVELAPKRVNGTFVPSTHQGTHELALSTEKQ